MEEGLKLLHDELLFARLTGAVRTDFGVIHHRCDLLRAEAIIHPRRQQLSKFFTFHVNISLNRLKPLEILFRNADSWSPVMVDRS